MKFIKGLRGERQMKEVKQIRAGENLVEGFMATDSKRALEIIIETGLEPYSINPPRIGHSIASRRGD